MLSFSGEVTEDKRRSKGNSEDLLDHVESEERSGGSRASWSMHRLVPQSGLRLASSNFLFRD
jgi:hypothetical protein